LHSALAHASRSAPTTPRVLGRVFLGLGIAVWIAGVLGFFASTAARKAAALGEDHDFAPAARAAGSQGWSVTHHLAADPDSAAILFAHWERRGATAGLAETITGPASLLETPAARRLRAAGWILLPQTAPVAEARLKVLSPDGRLAWSGAYRPAELRLSGGAIFDRLALRRVFAGERLPPFVPIGCAAPARETPLLSFLPLPRSASTPATRPPAQT